MKKCLLLLVAIVGSISAWAEQTVINVVARHARIAQYSTLYVGEVVADGQSFYYMYSEDITNSTTVLGAAKDCLSDFKDGAYSALMPSIVGETDEIGMAVCSNSAYESLMNSNWTSAANAAQACLPNATVTSSSTDNLFETDPDFAAKCLSVFLNEYDEADLLNQSGETLEVSSVLGKLSATNSDNVTYTVINGELVKIIDRTVDYTCESITVIYTKAELETVATTFAIMLPESFEHGTVTADKAEAAEGETVTLTVTPNPGYELDVLTVTTVDGEPSGAPLRANVDLTEGENGTYTFEMPAAPVNVNATFKKTGKPGDTNGDGKINVSDVTALVNMILGVIPKDEDRADINGDGKINVSDVTALVNIILGVS